jgi:hypothetical protein
MTTSIDSRSASTALAGLSAGRPLVGSTSLASVNNNGKSGSDSAEQAFLSFAKMSPMDRMRASILQGMGMTEDDVQSLPPADRLKIEEQIKNLIKQSAENNREKTGQLVDSTA